MMAQVAPLVLATVLYLSCAKRSLPRLVTALAIATVALYAGSVAFPILSIVIPSSPLAWQLINFGTVFCLMIILGKYAPTILPMALATWIVLEILAWIYLGAAPSLTTYQIQGHFITIIVIIVASFLGRFVRLVVLSRLR